MGIVNVTPDSFSDGGRYLEPESAVDHALRLVREGADLLDVGGESTRPGAAPVDEAEECRRVLPVIEALASTAGVPISIDTRKPRVAQAALGKGAALVNDIAANRADPALWRIVAEAGAGYVAMHMQGEPETMQRSPAYRAVTSEVAAFFDDRLARLAAAGVPPERVALDPGIGFGKTLAHNLTLLQQIAEFKRLARPLVLGLSRKSFLGSLTGAGVADRLPGGLAATVWAAFQGVQVFRTHDVAATVQALRVAEALSLPPE